MLNPAIAGPAAFCFIDSRNADAWSRPLRMSWIWSTTSFTPVATSRLPVAERSACCRSLPKVACAPAGESRPNVFISLVRLVKAVPS